MYNLRNRSFLKEGDFTARELEHLLRLSAALKARSTPRIIVACMSLRRQG